MPTCCTNLGQHASEQGIINNYHYNPANPLEELRKHCSPSAAFDSAARFDPPRCAESTRLRIISIIEEWINSDDDQAMPSSLFWLYGGAGVGKSAIAQSFSEKFQERKQLAASFFFFRSDASRNKGDRLIPTLISHLVDTFEGINPFVQNRIRKNWALFTKKYQVQIQQLLVGPLLALNLNSKRVPVAHPRLIVIDGLDECENADVQCELIRVIASAIPQIPYPLRFLVTSRPEAHITDVFNHDLQAITVRRYNLSDDPDADTDIRKFLEKEFVEIRRVHRLRRRLPQAWPGQKAIASLVERSSGHFIYASTVIRYIRCPKHRPDNRLEVILRLRPPQEGDRPYAQLDALYALVFKGVETQDQLEKICLVLGVVYFRSQKVGFFEGPHDPTIEEFLGMEDGDLALLLDPILSLVAIDDDEVCVLHKSLFDYLLDFTRCGHLPFDLARVHESTATWVLPQVETELRDIVITDFKQFVYHCQYAHLNDTLKDRLHNLVPHGYPHGPYVMFQRRLDDLHSLIWHFFRTLSREDFDSTRVHEEYAAKWMDYLHSVVPTCTQPEALLGAGDVDDLKRELDILLTEWKFRSLNPMDVGMDPVRRLAYVTQEHNVFSAYHKASHSGNTDISIVSSLVFGDYFIHSYDLLVEVEGARLRARLELRTYSRHGNICYQCPAFFASEDFLVQEMQYCLKEVEMHLCSDLYQMYGVKLD